MLGLPSGSLQALTIDRDLADRIARQEQAEQDPGQIIDDLPSYDESNLPDPFAKAPELGI